MPPARKKPARKAAPKSQLTNAKTLTKSRPEKRVSEQSVLDAQRAQRDADRTAHNVRRAQFGE